MSRRSRSRGAVSAGARRLALAAPLALRVLAVACVGLAGWLLGASGSARAGITPAAPPRAAPGAVPSYGVSPHGAPPHGAPPHAAAAAGIATSPARRCPAGHTGLPPFTAPSPGNGAVSESVARHPRPSLRPGRYARFAPGIPPMPVPRPLPRRVKTLPPPTDGLDGPIGAYAPFWRPAGFAGPHGPSSFAAVPRALRTPAGDTTGAPSFPPD